MDLALRTVLGPEVMGVLCVVTVSTASIVVVWKMRAALETTQSSIIYFNIF